jgi:hypothetical protein
MLKDIYFPNYPFHGERIDPYNFPNFYAVVVVDAVFQVDELAILPDVEVNVSFHEAKVQYVNELSK